MKIHCCRILHIYISVEMKYNDVMERKARLAGLKAFVAVLAVFIAAAVFQGGQIQCLIKDTREVAGEFYELRAEHEKLAERQGYYDI